MRNDKKKLGGSVVAMVTPMTPIGEVDWRAFRGLIDFHIAEGTDAILIAGTSGESPTVSMEENRKLIGDAVAHADGRISIVAGTGANATDEAIALSRFAADAGADYSLSVAPYYNRPTQEGMYRHFCAIAESADIPLILYNVPSRTASDLQNETALRLAAVDNIVGIKDAVGDVIRARELIDNSPSDFLCFSGDDKTAREYMLAGGDGVISVTANVAPKKMHEMCQAAISGDAESAAEIDSALAAFHRAQAIESNPIPTKWSLWKMGKIDRGIRLPLTELTESNYAAVADALAAAGIAITEFA